MHDGSTLRIRKLGHDYDPNNKMHALAALSEAEKKGEVLTGVLYLDTGKPNFIDMLNMADEPLATLPQSRTRPSKESLDLIMEELR
jgi:2-oxoglutarate ferredoxin oxidoreductase subunit beta